MKRNLTTTSEKVNYHRWTNKAINAKNDIARTFFAFAHILKKIKDYGYYDIKYDNFREYCENEIGVDWRTAYDYVKIAEFVEQNCETLTLEKAGLLGHKKLKLLSQKLSHVEDKYRKAILRRIDENDSFTQIKGQLEKTLVKLNIRQSGDKS